VQTFSLKAKTRILVSRPARSDCNLPAALHPEIGVDTSGSMLFCRVDQHSAGALLDDSEELVSNIVHIRASVVVAVSNHSQCRI